jgi:hypothetical protein
MRQILMSNSAVVDTVASSDAGDTARVLSVRNLRSVRLAVAAVLALQGLAASWDAAAQSQGPTLTVYPDPIGWGHLPNSPGGGGWFWGGGSRYETYVADPWVPVPVEKVACELWDERNPKPATCGAPPPDVSANGCGPAGLLSVIGTLYPDSFFSFACDVHDVCYSQPGAVKETCDRDMLTNMRNICKYAFGCEYDWEQRQNLCWGTPEQESQCYGEAQRILDDFFGYFAQGVIQSRFNTLQDEAKCRVWHNARANESDCEHP